MLSNHEHIIINRQNYEAYFLLYVDGELTREQRNIVTDFAAVHPDLQQELQLLLATKLPPEAMSFPGKDRLLAQNRADSVVDENLLLYIDGELPLEQILATEKKIKEDSAYRKQYKQLKATKLDGTEQTVFPFKNDLYRSHQKRTSPLVWRLAAAAVFLILAGSVVWFSSNGDSQTIPAVTVKTQAPATDAQQTNEQPNTVAVSKSQNDLPTPEVAGKKAETTTKNNIDRTRIAARSAAAPVPKKNMPQQAPLIANKDNHTAYNRPAPQSAMPVQSDPDQVEQKPQQTINTEPVTTNAAPAYNNTNALTTADAGSGTDLASASRKGSVRGFLRKATRFIERRTGINPVNEDDELLIGVVAIKL